MKTGAFTSRLRSPAVAARIGIWVGICFGVCFVTGLISHYAQLPQQPVAFPASPSWGYRLTQTLHVVSGTAAIPLLLVKLWAVYPRLFQALPRRLGEVVLAALERGSIAVLVAGSLLELAIGVMNVAQWYVWRFDFRATHYALAWAVIGALLVHVAVKLPVIRDALTNDVDSVDRDRPEAVVAGVVGRRAVIRTGWLAAAVAVVTTSSATGTVPGLDRLAVLSPRSRRSGIPVNRTAADARVAPAALSAGYRCRIDHAGGSTTFARADLLALPQSTHTLPIACVEGWSADGSWTGVPLRVLLDRVGSPRGRAVVVTSLEPQGPERVSTLPADFADDPRTLLALALDGEPLSLDHGYPVRLIAPDRPGALQTKWIARIEVL
ncbi:molybdopterin-dependent oxidoreductase [Nocardioides maradonensis]